ncbi:hypothetical protein [Sphingobacterium sp. LRF_L2]
MKDLTEKELVEIEGGSIIGSIIKAAANAAIEAVGDMVDNWRGPNI